MDVTGKNQEPGFQGTSSSRRSTMGGSSGDSRLSEAASDLLKDGKKVANGLYEEGMSRVSEVQDSLKSYSDELVKHVHEKPMTSLLMAAGVGYILSSILRK